MPTGPTKQMPSESGLDSTPKPLSAHMRRTSALSRTSPTGKSVREKASSPTRQRK